MEKRSFFFARRPGELSGAGQCPISMTMTITEIYNKG